MAVSTWVRLRPVLLELFVAFNFAFLVLDVYLAHLVNRFRHPAEWVPVWFSLLASVGVVLGLVLRTEPHGRFYRGSGFVLGGTAIVVGVVGTVLHLQSQFFSQWTIRSLVYTAPFVAPLAYVGLGFLLLLNRMVASEEEEEWSGWVVFFALGGFVGNFVLSLCDHAQNGFFHASEWIPVFGSGLAIGFLTVALWERRRSYLRLCLAVMGIQAGIGVLGFALHLRADVNGLSASVVENFIHGAPLFAPLLFANLALLAAFGLWSPRLFSEQEGRGVRKDGK